MKNLIPIFLLVAALCLGWQYMEVSGGKAELETKLAESNSEIETLKAEVKAANNRANQAGDAAHPQASQSGTKPNWIDERNHKWQSSLTGGSSGSSGPGAAGGGGKGRPRGAMPPPPQPTNYLTDSQGRYWVDPSGAKHYVQ